MNVREARDRVQEIKRELPMLRSELVKTNQALTTWLALADRAGLPRPWIDKLRAMQQMRIAIQSLQRAWTLMQAGGLLSFVTGAGGALLAGFMITSSAASLFEYEGH